MESFIYACVDKWNVEIQYYTNRFDCTGNANWTWEVPVSLIGWQWANCGNNTDCVAVVTGYENNSTGK